MADIVIVGGGIVGLAVAKALIDAHPRLSIQVLEKEDSWATHQTTRNSGVVHSGIYYSPGSLKARLARAGNARMIDFCRDRGIRHEVCGKVVVATSADELPALERLAQRAAANQVAVERLDAPALAEREPHVRGVSALLVPTTAITDFGDVARELAAMVSAQGVELHLSTRLESIERSHGEIRLGTSQHQISTRFLINCAGLQSDHVAELDGANPRNRVLPFRGDYFELRPERAHLVRHLVYPVPDPRFPFLGVHLTRSIHGHVHVGPNAVLSLAREGYQRTAINFSDTRRMLQSSGFWGYAARHWKHGLSEAATAFNVKAFARRLQALVPEIRPEDLIPCDSGIRAQSVTPRGDLVEDFQIVAGKDSLHVCNAASPAATASLEMGHYIARLAAEAQGFPSTSATAPGWTEPEDEYCGGLCEI